MTHEQLVQARQACRLCMGKDPDSLRNPSRYDFDRPIISYWSQWMGHLSPELLVVGQDFSDWAFFEDQRGQDEADCVTNKNLRSRLADAGFNDIQLGHDPDARVYLTNAILCLKRPPVTSAVKARWVKNCAETHLTRLIDVLQPKAVVATGSHAWAAVLQAANLIDAPQKIAAAADLRTPFFSALERYDGIAFFAVGHTGGLGVVNRSTIKQVGDWQEIGHYLEGVRARTADKPSP